MFRYLVIYLFLHLATLLYAQQITHDSVQANSKFALADTNNTKLSGPQISFMVASHDAKTVQLGSKLSYDFEFNNSGDEPLLISNVRTSCNCAVASYPKTPVLPGKTGKVSIDMDTSILGSFNKVVAVYSNAKDKARTILHIRWHVASSSPKAK